MGFASSVWKAAADLGVSMVAGRTSHELAARVGRLVGREPPSIGAPAPSTPMEPSASGGVLKPPTVAALVPGS